MARTLRECFHWGAPIIHLRLNCNLNIGPLLTYAPRLIRPPGLSLVGPLHGHLNTAGHVSPTG